MGENFRIHIELGGNIAIIPICNVYITKGKQIICEHNLISSLYFNYKLNLAEIVVVPIISELPLLNCILSLKVVSISPEYLIVANYSKYVSVFMLSLHVFYSELKSIFLHWSCTCV